MSERISRDLALIGEKKKSAYKLCWVCNKRFRGSHKYEYTIPYGGRRGAVGLFSSTVYVHKGCRP